MQHSYFWSFVKKDLYVVRAQKLIGLSYIYERPILMERLNLRLVQISQKAPPPAFGEILGLYRVMLYNFTKPYSMHH